MNDKDTEGEDHPLKNSEGKAVENNNDTGGEKDVCIKKQNRLSRLSKIRTAAFFGALFLCLAAVFAFSFIIPCPVRPFSQRTWSLQYNNSVGYPFLATEDVNKDNVQDVLFIFKTDSASQLNVSCADEGFQSPCFFLSALSGTNGSTLWVRPVSDDDVQLVECSIHNLGGGDSVGCLVIRKSGFILAIDSTTGHALWEKPTGFVAGFTVIKPVLKIPDVDRDGIEDLMVFIFAENELQSAVFSGKNGDRIGQKWTISTDQPSGYYTHVTKSKAYYVLFYKGSSIAAYSVSGLCSHTAGLEAKPTGQDSDWEAQMNSSTGFIPLMASSSSGNILYILNVPGRYYNNILVVKSEVSELLDGQKFQTLWSVNTTNILSKPALGFFKRDVLSIMMELETGMNRKKVIIVDSNSGALQWEYDLSLGIARQNPAVLNTGDHRSTFLFWGVNSPEPNNITELEENLFMFHPSHPKALLQLNNHTENIIMFRAALFERSRHACYVLITGPNTTEDPGTLMVSKRKLKEDISNAKVIWFGTEEVNTEAIRDEFFRMRYTSH
ncbi:protein FAM234A [Hyla sarda]|uniref:protein FAM234A n=1 Tax=Hyla sarda TaxID=327740 RepID=UPI0024C29FC4|nr:protein FAM234A [Hyla sarda]XP_056392938.1 protein FAM234A [Hyla sarda]